MPAWLGLMFGCLFLLSSALLILAWKAYKNYKHICELYTTMGIMRHNLNLAKAELDKFLRSNFKDYKSSHREMDI